MHVAVAQTAVQRPALGELPLRLRVIVGTGDGVLLVALQDADHAVVVDVALAPLVHRVSLDPRSKLHGRKRMEVAERAAAVVAVEVDDATGVIRSVLNVDRDGEELLDIALTGIEHRLDAAVAETVGKRPAGLVLRHALLRVE